MSPRYIRTVPLAIPAEQGVRLVSIEVGFEDEFVTDVNGLLHLPTPFRA
jgi:hypothetical protein